MRKTLLIFLLALAAMSATKAQNWGGGIDDQDFNWGFSFQYIASEFKIIRTPTWQTPFKVTDPSQGNIGDIVTPPLNSISSRLSAGFGIGFVMNYKVTNYLDVRSTPGLAFTDRLVDYQYATEGVNNNPFENGKKEQKMSPVIFDFPLGLKLKSDRRRDFRAYLLLGAKYSLDLTGGGKAKDDGEIAINRLLKNKRAYASYEAALGFDLYFEYFKMSPELKVSHSFGDVIKRENHPFDTPIEKAILRNFTFSLFFE